MTPTKTWIVMNDLQESFNQITHFDFLIDKLNEAVNANDQQKIVDISAALTAFYPVYVSYVAGKVFKEIVEARDYKDARETALARNPNAKVIGVTAVFS